MSAFAIRGASLPLMRTMPMPPRPGGVAMATMVSAVENMPAASIRLPATDYFTEIITVFSNASPMLSEEMPSISDTARWTIRRS